MASSPAITFSTEPVHSTRRQSSEYSTGADTDHGIVFQRTFPVARNTLRAKALEGLSSRRRSRESSGRESSGIDEESEISNVPREFTAKQTFHGRQLLFLAYLSIGVIYGDIGTSPLYVFSSTFPSGNPSNEDLVGVLSLIIWSLLWMVTLKYILVILRADNHGEGGAFSAYCLLARFANITYVDPKEKSARLERYKANDLPKPNLKIRDWLERSIFMRGLLKTIGVLAVSMVLSDGVLTPPQSMLGAYQGLKIAANVTNGQVVGASCGTLVLLFLVQPLGTARVGMLFAPVVIIWLGLTGGVGLYNLINYDWTVLRAFNPGLAFRYLIRNGQQGWVSLGGVLLAFTGVEALFADLGAFSMRAIQLSWFIWVLPMLLLTYSGQAAYISVFPDAVASPVFNTAPNGMLIVMIVFAVLAASVASQAIITATFQLLAQIVKLSYFPTIAVVHTSKIYHNQLYVPLVNWLLMISCILVTAIYSNTTTLGDAYGVCVIFVVFFDTVMVTLVALLVWKKPLWLVILPALAFACFDAAFLSSALIKVPHGAWFTLTLAAVLTSLFVLWRYGKEKQWTAEAVDKVPLSKFVQEKDAKFQLVHRPGEELSRSKGYGIFFDKVGVQTPIVFSQYIEKLAVVPEISIFLRLSPVEAPTVLDSERYWVTKMKLRNCYRIVIRHGYLDRVLAQNLGSVCHMHVKRYILSRDANSCTSAEMATSSEHVDQTLADRVHGEDELLAQELTNLDSAFASRMVYIVGKEEIRLSPKMPPWKKAVLGTFLFIRRNTRTKIHNLALPPEWLVEIGFVKELE